MGIVKRVASLSPSPSPSLPCRRPLLRPCPGLALNLALAPALALTSAALPPLPLPSLPRLASPCFSGAAFACALASPWPRLDSLAWPLPRAHAFDLGLAVIPTYELMWQGLHKESERSLDVFCSEYPFRTVLTKCQLIKNNVESMWCLI